MVGNQIKYNDKNFENQLRFDKVTESSKVGTFFETQCRSIQKQKMSFAGRDPAETVPCIYWKENWMVRQQMWIDGIKHWMKLKTYEDVQIN